MSFGGESQTTRTQPLSDPILLTAAVQPRFVHFLKSANHFTGGWPIWSFQRTIGRLNKWPGIVWISWVLVNDQRYSPARYPGLTPIQLEDTQRPRSPYDGCSAIAACLNK